MRKLLFGLALLFSTAQAFSIEPPSVLQVWNQPITVNEVLTSATLNINGIQRIKLTESPGTSADVEVVFLLTDGTTEVQSVPFTNSDSTSDVDVQTSVLSQKAVVKVYPRATGSAIITIYGAMGGDTNASLTNASNLTSGTIAEALLGSYVVTNSYNAQGVTLISSTSGVASSVTLNDGTGRITAFRGAEAISNGQIGTYTAQDFEIYRNAQLKITIGDSQARVSGNNTNYGDTTAALEVYNPEGDELQIGNYATSRNAWIRAVRPATGFNDLMLQPDGGSVAVGFDPISTSATTGFLYIPTCAGVPSGTPATIGSLAPMVVDTSNNRLYVYISGSWRAMN